MNAKVLALGNKVRHERKLRNLSQEELAEKAQLAVRTISDLERGITDIRYTNLLQIADAFDMTISALLDFKL